MNKYILELTTEELDVLDNFIHEFLGGGNELLEEGSESVFRKVCDLCEEALTEGDSIPVENIQ